MSKWLSVVLAGILIGFLVVGFAPLESTTARMSVVALGPGYVHEDGRLDQYDLFQNTFDQPVFAVGYVEAFLGPLAHLDASEPGVEYTWVTTDQLSAGGAFGHNDDDCVLHSLDAQGGLFKILRDPTPDADLSDPSTFADGEVLLRGRFPDIISPSTFSLINWWCPDNTGGQVVEFYLKFDGGTVFPILSPTKPEMDAVVVGTFEIGDQLPPEILDLDYFAQLEATVQVEDTVPVQPTTWGRIKAKYGN